MGSENTEVLYNGLLLTRQEAIDAGSIYYFTGKPCKSGHIDKRYVKTRNCVRCSLDRSKNKTPSEKINGVDYGYTKGHKPWNYNKSSVKVGQVYESVGNYGKFEVISYTDCYNVTIKFLSTGYTYPTTAGKIRKGEVKDYTLPSVHGKGFNSLGRINRSDPIDSVAYQRWRAMLRRCYDKSFHKKNKTYADCTVCDDWLDYKNFRSWFVVQYKCADGIKWELDKDIINNYTTKEYCPDNCCLLPSNINRLVVKQSEDKKDTTFMGVELLNNGLYRSYCSDMNGKRKELGRYVTELEAFKSYANYKDYIIRFKAEEYKEVLSDRVYNALLSYDTYSRYMEDQ